MDPARPVAVACGSREHANVAPYRRTAVASELASDVRVRCCSRHANGARQRRSSTSHTRCDATMATLRRFPNGARQRRSSTSHARCDATAATLQRLGTSSPTFAAFPPFRCSVGACLRRQFGVREWRYCLTSTFVISSDSVAMPPDDASKHMSFRKRRSLRLPCHDYSESRPYHVTWGTHDRKRILWREDLARAVIDCVEAEAVRAPVNLLAYCVMPDHVHVLLMPRDGANVIPIFYSLRTH